MVIEKSFKVNKNIKQKNSKKRIVIISDTHMSPSGEAFNQKAFDQGINKINAIKDVTLYIHLGDLTQSGTLLDYEFALEQFKKFKPELNAELRCLIGNHDSLNVGYLLFEEMISKRYFEFEDEYLYVTGIDSTKPDLAGGIIHRNIIEAVRKRLEKPERKDKFKIVCFHHQLIPIPNTGKERSAIDDSGNVLKMLIDAKADLVLNGHRHISNIYTVSSSEKDLYIFNSGTFCCNKTRYRELFTYNIIDIEGKKINFKVIPIYDSDYKKEISREVNYYAPVVLAKNRKLICKFIQIANSFISEHSEDKVTSLDRSIKMINNIKNVDLVIHSGNVTKNSFKNEFIIAKEKLNNLTRPYIVIPGYSDSKPSSSNLWERFIGPSDPLYENDRLYFQGIDSTTPDSKTGFIGRQKLNSFIDKVLNLSHQKIIGVSCFHSLIPTPLSVWRTELIDSGDVLSQFARSQVDLVLNSSPSISFNAKIEHTIFSNGGNLEGTHFDETFVEIDIYKNGLMILIEHDLNSGKKKVIGSYYITIFK